MGCNNSKFAALQELEQITKQIREENLQLEEERDKLKIQHDDRPEEEKDSLQDLRSMHFDLEKEIKELKEIMLEFMPIPENKDNTFLLVKNSIERIIQIQSELDEQSETLRQMVSKPKDLQKEQETLEGLIRATEKEIQGLENTIEKQEKVFREQSSTKDNKIYALFRQRTSIVEDSRGHDTQYSNLYEEIRNWGHDDSLHSDSHDNLLFLSELEINKELAEVNEELEDLSSQIYNLELTEGEITQMSNYINFLKIKLESTAKNSNIKQLIIESKEKIDILKQEKKKLKQEVINLKKYSTVDCDKGTNQKIQALNDILNRKTRRREITYSKPVEENLLSDIEKTLKKAREIEVDTD
jgi:myosin heavy subunit